MMQTKKLDKSDKKRIKDSGMLNNKLITYLNAFDKIKEW